MEALEWQNDTELFDMMEKTVIRRCDFGCP